MVISIIRDSIVIKGVYGESRDIPMGICTKQGNHFRNVIQV